MRQRVLSFIAELSKLAGFLEQAERKVAPLNHFARNLEVAHALVVGPVSYTHLG